MSQAANNLDKFRGPEDGRHTKARFTIGERAVFFTIVSMSLINGMMTTLITRKVFFMPPSEDRGHLIFNWILPLAPSAGPLVVASLSEFRGRRVVFILLAALSTISYICLFSQNKAVIVIGVLTSAIARGGGQTMFCIAIAEYCSAKHRFAFCIASVTAWYIVGQGVHIIFTEFIEASDLSWHLPVFGISVGLVCLGSSWVWPESPYWLASRGRCGDAAWSLRRLRGAGAELELSQLQGERHSPNSWVYWRQLLITLIVITVCAISDILEHCITFQRDDPSYVVEIGGSVMILIAIAAVSYFVKRKVLYISCCAVPIACYYLIGFWICVEGTLLDKPFKLVIFVSNILCKCGPNLLSMVLAAELIPYKDNTRISCVCTFYMTTLIFSGKLIFKIPVLKENYMEDLIISLASLQVLGLVVFWWAAQETKDRTLFELQKLQSPQYVVANPQQHDTAMREIYC